MAVLPHISQAMLSGLSPPTLKIRTDADVETWRNTTGYRFYTVFLRRLNESVVGYELPLQDECADSEAITKLLTLLNELDVWIDEIPPLPTPQRYGNVAFRDFGSRLHERSENILQSLLPSSLHVVIPLIQPYFLTSFGSFQRIDYGSGHETSFALFLCSLALLRFFNPVPIEERRIVLLVFERYLHLVWKLQDVYRLEPAGSHGVWGLDDYGFLGYIFGSGQLRDREDVSPSAILRTPLPSTNLYYTSIMRVHELKRGPFHEHSPQLHSIAEGVAKWSKVNSGMFKMYEAEVLRKRVVVQHIPLGGLFPWDAESSEEKISKQVTANDTTAPWAPSGFLQAQGRESIPPPDYVPR